MRNPFNKISPWLGIELDPVSRKEKYISGIVGGLAILLVTLVSQQALHLTGATMLIASMGASAVLLFAVPHGALSQPWPVIGGHTLSALAGVLSATFIPNIPLAAAVAVGISIGVMHHFKCIHPPGGATALTAVIGGTGIHEIGFSFIWFPVLSNTLILVATAVLFNAFFQWRRYPAFWSQKFRPEPGDQEVTHEDVVAALESFDSFVDITERDLIRLHLLLARRIAPRKTGLSNLDPSSIGYPGREKTPAPFA